MASEIMTVPEAADYLRMSGETLKRLARGGLVPSAKVGRQWRFRKNDLDRWLAQGGTRYEERVDQGLMEISEERAADAAEKPVPWEQAKAELDL